ncbi:MAG: ATP-grasp domain-containing protein [Planctomycetota bacterium]|nr:MAG: ATP-grasp domain-containing protein [Sandaracinaceae bacterium]HBQ11787.1 ATPase [Myxococcales bacterium]
MDVILVEPCFPRNQREFARALHSVGARVIGIGERPKEALDDSLRHWLTHYEQVSNVCDEAALEKAVRFVQSISHPERLEATVEAHIQTAAQVRERCGIPGTSAKTAFLCRDKPSMKEVLRQAGVPCAASTGTGSPDEARAFAARVGYPLILKPRDGAGAAGTFRVDDDAELEAAMQKSGLGRGASVAIEEFVEGHEGFYDTVTVDGRVVHEFVCHYYPNVLEAMRTRWISPQFITTNRVESAPGYEEVRAMGRRVIEALDIGTSATHMEWFFGPKGLRFSEIGCRPPGVGAWDLYSAGNEMDLYREWAMAVVHGRPGSKPSRRYAAGIIALRPDRDGVIDHYDGLEEVQRNFGEHLIDAHLPPAGTPTQPVEAGYMANAWMRFRHPDYDTLRRILDAVGQTVQVRAR